MTALYIASTEGLPDPGKQPSVMEGLSRERKEIIMKYRQEKDRILSLGAGLLLREILSRNGRDMAEIYLGKNGKPLMDGLCFNLSHTEGRVLLAIGSRAVGCDIERVKKMPAHLSRRFFCPDEQKYLSAFPEGPERDRAFFRLWTCKESYMKMTGEGMHLPLSAFEVVLSEKPGIRREGIPENCFLKTYTLGDYQAAVCAGEDIIGLEPEKICLL